MLNRLFQYVLAVRHHHRLSYVCCITSQSLSRTRQRDGEGNQTWPWRSFQVLRQLFWFLLIHSDLANHLNRSCASSADLLVESKTLFNLRWMRGAVHYKAQNKPVFESLGTALAVIYIYFKSDKWLESGRGDRTYGAALDAQHLRPVPSCPLSTY